MAEVVNNPNYKARKTMWVVHAHAMPARRRDPQVQRQRVDSENGPAGTNEDEASALPVNGVDGVEKRERCADKGKATKPLQPERVSLAPAILFDLLHHVHQQRSYNQCHDRVCEIYPASHF